MTGLDTRSDASASAVLRAVLLTDLVGSTRLTEAVGDRRTSEISARHDQLARELLAEYDGLEIDKTDGFLLLFERPAQAVAYALAYHRALVELSAELGVGLEARAGIHLGEVILRENPEEQVQRGAKPVEAEGLAKPTAARVMALAEGGQTLMSRGAFDLARRAVVGGERDDLEWRAHGAYLFKGLDEPMEIFEVGVPGVAPFRRPAGSDKAQRSVTPDEETTLGWRPAVGLTVPGRDHWVLDSETGEGGFGEVWIANHNKTTGKRVFKFCFEAERVRGLRREVVLFRLLQQSLGHREDIAQILDWQFEEAPYFLEAEYSEGGDLRSWAEDRGGLPAIPLQERLEIVAQVAVALGAAHSAGVLHKDIKPANVLIQPRDDGSARARLTDFGIGLVTDRASLSGGVTVAGFTQTLLASGSSGSTGGTPMYIAPEVLSGQPSTTLSDVYALGVMLYQTVTGDFSRALAPGWEREIDDELLRDDIAGCVDGDPDRRLRSSDELADRLRHLDERHAQREAEILRMRQLENARRRRRLFAIASTVGIVLTLLAATFAWRERSRASAEVALKQQARRQLYISDMNIASQAWEEGDIDRLKVHLEAHRPRSGESDLRNFEWYYWWRAAHLHRGRLRHFSSAPYSAMAVSPDGETVVVQGEVPTMFELYDSSTQRLLARLASGDAVPGSVAISADGRRLVHPVGSNRGIRVFDNETWRLTMRDLVPSPPPEGFPADDRAALATSPSEEALITGDQAGRVIFWGPGGPSYAEVGGPVRSIAFTPDGRHAVVATGRAGYESIGAFDHKSATKGDRGLILLESGSLRILQKIDFVDTVHTVAVSPDGSAIAAGDVGGTVGIWELGRAGLERRSVLAAEAPVTTLAFSPDSRRLAAGTDVTNVVEVWEMGEEPRHLASLKGHAMRVNAVVFVGDGDTLWSAGRDGFVRIWDLTRATPFKTIAQSWTPSQFETTHDSPSSILGYTEDSSGVMVLDAERRVRRWKAATSEASGSLAENETILFSAANDGSAAALITADGFLRVIDSTGAGLFEVTSVFDPTTPLLTQCGVPACVFGLAISSGGRRVAWSIGWPDIPGSPTDRSGVYLRDMAAGSVSFLPGWFRMPSLSPDDRRMAAVGGGDRTLLLDVTEDPPVEIAGLQGWGAEARSAFSLDSTRVAIGSANRTIRIHDVESGELIARLRGHAGGVTSTAFSPAGDLLVSASHDGTVRIWDLETSRVRSTMRAHEGAVIGVAWAPDGRSIASAGIDGTVRVFLTASVAEGEDFVEDLLDYNHGNRTGPLDENLPRLDTAMALFPEDPRVFEERGDLEAYSGRMVEALHDYDRAEALGESGVPLLAKLATALSATGDWSRLTEVASRLIEKTDGQELSFLLMRAHGRARAGQNQAAKEDALRAWHLRPTPHTGHLIQKALALGTLVSVAQRGPAALDIPVMGRAGGRSLADGAPFRVEWSYTTSAPGEGWKDPETFDDSSWQSGPAPFLNHSHSDWSPIGTHWGESHDELWLRHGFDLEEPPEGPLRFEFKTGGPMTLYLNGVEAATTTIRGSGYDSILSSPEARLRPGRNVLAAHVRAGYGGSTFDAGLYRSLDEAQLEAALANHRIAQHPLSPALLSAQPRRQAETPCRAPQACRKFLSGF